MLRTCKKHGLVEHRPRRRSSWRCRKCAVEAVTRRRRRMKKQLIAEFGGKCVLCGYDRCPDALCFHHRNPEDKEFQVSDNMTRSLDRMRTEAAKCDLICANCHAEKHYQEDE